MRVVFMGTPEFAVPSLRALSAEHDVSAVFTQPDRVRGRGRQLVPSPVKEAAQVLGLRIEQPASMKDPRTIQLVRDLVPDVICVAAYGAILPAEVLEIPRFGCINVHASLLPRHRGAAPVHRAILEGDAETGVSIMRMEAGLDTGPVADTIAVPVDDHTVTTLTALLAEEGAHALLATLKRVELGTVRWTPQDDARATYAPKITAADVALDPCLRTDQALRRVRVSTSSARARLCLDGRNVAVLSATRSSVLVSPGVVRAERDALLLGFSDGALVAAEVRPEGKASMEGACFARGARLASTCEWVAPE